LLVSWLPTNYGMGFFATLNAVMQIIYQIVTTIYTFFALIFALIARLLIPSSMNMPQQVMPVETPPPEGLPPATPSGIDWNLVSSVIFWLVLVVLVMIALRQYIAFHRDLSDELKRFKPLKWLLAAWERLKVNFRKANKSVGALIQSGIKRLRSLGATPPSLDEWDYINPHKLNSREKIIFYYLALVRRAREAGLPRQDGDTPYEYARSLTSNLEEGKEGVQAITESFVEARYTRHNITAEDAHRANSTWEAIRRALRNVRKARQEDKPKKD
jgi:hypothetical protein